MSVVFTVENHWRFGFYDATFIALITSISLINIQKITVQLAQLNLFTFSY